MQHSNVKPRRYSSTLRSQKRWHLAGSVYVIFGASTALRHVALPPFLTKTGMLFGIVWLGHRIFRFRRWAHEHRYVIRFLLCFLAMLLQLTIENGMVWLVSALDKRKYDTVPGLQVGVVAALLTLHAWTWPGIAADTRDIQPIQALSTYQIALQDNLELAIHALGSRSWLVVWAARAKWADALHFLLALLALAFSVLWDQVPYSGFGIMSRAVLTICCSRLIRVACFMCTILPSPRPGCYSRRFPPPPDTLWETIKAGYTTIRGFGGCNDLIFSGHGQFWTLVPLAFQTYYRPSYGSSALLWVAVVQASVRDVMDKQHYSVDMLLAVVVTWAVWSWLEWVYPPSCKLQQQTTGGAADQPNPFVIAVIAFGLLAAGVIIIGGKA